MACIRVPGPWVLVPPSGRVQYLLELPGRSQRRRWARRPGDVARRAGRVRRPARRAGRARGDDDALRALPCGLDREEAAGVPAAARLRAAAGRRRPLDGLRARDAGGTVDRVPVAHRHHRPGPGASSRRWRASRARSSSARGTRSRSASRSRRSSVAASLVDVTRRSVGKQVVATASATDGLSIDVHAVVQVGAECAP